MNETLKECESERVRECESQRVTFEHRHENKSCLACQELVNESKSERLFQAFQVYQGHKLTVLL